jgi:hypothetical protein
VSPVITASVPFFLLFSPVPSLNQASPSTPFSHPVFLKFFLWEKARRKDINQDRGLPRHSWKRNREIGERREETKRGGDM